MRYVSDTARANWSSLIGVVAGVGAAAGMLALRGGIDLRDSLGNAITVYLFAWVIFTAVYVFWTHRAYGDSGPRALTTRARRERQWQRRWWSALMGYGGASSWTLTAALASVVITILIAQEPSYRRDVVYVTLGLLCVASSWAQMVYSFALEYLRLESAAQDGPRHIEMGVEGEARFGDYLTLAILLSTMAATVSAKIRTREGWRLVRVNVLFAFAFNSVIVAMVVSLLLSGLAGG